jgi:uncharacterized protein
MPGKGQISRLNQNRENYTLIIFIRAPEKGKVKTRLARSLDEESVLDFYRGVVEKILDTTCVSGIIPVICFCPEDKETLVKDWLGSTYDYVPQKGEDLGERMSHALACAFENGAEKAVLIGSDFPDILPGHLKSAFLNLGENDAVIGPSLDGGYWLIGFTQKGFRRSVFEDIQWSTKTVFQDTVLKCESSGLLVKILTVLRDIDTIEDLAQYQSDL